MRIKMAWWFEIWGLFVHDSEVIGPISEWRIEEWINEELCGTGYTVMCPEDSGSRSWHLYTVQGNRVVSKRLHTSTEAVAEIKRLAPEAYKILAEIDKRTFQV